MLTHFHDPYCTASQVVDIVGYHMIANDMSLLHKVAAIEAINWILGIGMPSRVSMWYSLMAVTMV